VYLTDMERLREGATFVAYAQKDPLIEYKQEAFAAFQDLTAAIQSDIVRYLFHVQIQAQPAPQAMEQQFPPAPAERAAADGGTAAVAAGVAGEEEEVPEFDDDARGEAEVAASGPPAARPAAAAASRRLDRASRPQGPQPAPAGAGMPARPAPLPPPVVAGAGGRITNVVESSSEGVRSAGNGSAARGNGRPGAAGAARSRTKVGRNDPCPCGSGRKYKRCHGAATATSG
jgi:preprotein translocase subunit SecA